MNTIVPRPTQSSTTAGSSKKLREIALCTERTYMPEMAGLFASAVGPRATSGSSASRPTDAPGESFPAAKPFLKWLGGKRKLVKRLRHHVPPEIRTYFEPFLGGGAPFFALRPRNAVLSDNNLRVVRTWRGVRDNVEDVIELLRKYPNDEAFFYEFRGRPVDTFVSDAEVAAWLVYVNKTAFNGLYRVNGQNEVNASYGHYKNPRICDKVGLRACARALADVAIEHGDFADVVARAVAGDFVYLDPPYVPLSKTSHFTNYTAKGFGPEEHERLRDTARTLKARGVGVLLSNSAAEAVRQLYADGFSMEEVLAPRSINCKVDRRGAIPELLIW